MTDRQRKFADEYLIDSNATRAYKAAYPRIKNDNVASAAGTRLLGNVKVKTYIDDKLEELSSNKIADAQEVMGYLTSVLRGESKASVVVVEGCGDGCSKAKILAKSPDEKERLKAAEMLGRRYGVFKDNINATVEPSDKLDGILRQLTADE